MDDSAFTDLAYAKIGQQQPQSVDDGLAVTFEVEAQEDEEASKKAGRRVFKNVEMVEIRIPGDIDIRRSVVDDDIKARFARRYEHWKRGQTDHAAEGTPLTEWPPISKAQIAEARFLGIYTVQQLAAVADGNAQRLGPGWVSLRQKAKDWADTEKKNAPIVALRNENEALKARLTTLEAMLSKQASELQRGAPAPAAPSAEVEALKAMVEKLAAQVSAPVAAQQVEAAPKRRGRPPGSKNKPKNEAEVAPK